MAHRCSVCGSEKDLRKETWCYTGFLCGRCDRIVSNWEKNSHMANDLMKTHPDKKDWSDSDIEKIHKLIEIKEARRQTNYY